MTRKLVINKCYGGFRVSCEALLELYKRGSEFIRLITVESYKEFDLFFTKDVLKEWREWKEGKIDNPSLFFTVFTDDEKFIIHHETHDDKFREDPILIEVMEEWGSDKVSHSVSELKIIEIPNDVRFYIDEYDGIESVHEEHISWG